MKIINFFILLFTLVSLQANEVLIEKKKVPINIALPLLQSIDQYSIYVGTGPISIYAFIDPLCPRSQDFVEMVVENKKMQTRYTYHFFLYELERFNTKKLIAEIYNNKKPFSVVKRIMLDKEELKGLNIIPAEINVKINAIKEVAKKLDIYKRPYLFVVKPQKGGK